MRFVIMSARILYVQSSKHTGRQLFGSVASPFLKMGERFPCFHSSGMGEPFQISFNIFYTKAIGAASGFVMRSRMLNLDDIIFRASIGRLLEPDDL